MKRYLIPAAALFVLIASAFACANQSSAKNNVNNKIAGNGFAVIELFTSEGCSSCPLLMLLSPNF